MNEADDDDLDSYEAFPEEKSPASNRGQFFSVSLTTLDSIARAGGQAEAILGYIVLSRHTKGKGTDAGKFTAAGTQAIAEKVGLTRTKAEKALTWLSTHYPSLSPRDKKIPFIVSADEARKKSPHIPAHFGQARAKHTQIRWVLNPGENLLYLANALVDGLGRGKENPPLQRIYNQVKPDFAAGISMSAARLDVVMVLLHLYRHHDLEGCGGVNPRACVYREWDLVADADYENAVQPIEGTNAILYAIEGGSRRLFPSFAREALSYVEEDKERNTRFSCAFHNLQRLGLLYEVLVIWDSNPIENSGAEPLYTLYIHDRHARESEPYIQKDVHNIAYALEARERHYDFHPDPSEYGDDDRDLSSFIKSGRFRYIATQQTGEHPIGVYRLRFRPRDRDMGLGILAEKRRCEEWRNIFGTLRVSQQAWELRQETEHPLGFEEHFYASRFKE